MENNNRKGCRWVKASERLPEGKGQIFIRSVHTKAGGMIWAEELIKIGHTENIEWLDEESIDIITDGREEKIVWLKEELQKVQEEFDLSQNVISIQEEEIKELKKANGSQEAELWVNVHDNSDGFRNFLDSKGIEYKVNGHYTMVKKEVDIYWLGRQCEEYKQRQSPIEPCATSSEDYWKQRCEAAEELMKVMDVPKNKSDRYGGNSQFELFGERNQKWQQLTSATPTGDRDCEELKKEVERLKGETTELKKDYDNMFGKYYRDETDFHTDALPID